MTRFEVLLSWEGRGITKMEIQKHLWKSGFPFLPLPGKTAGDGEKQVEITAL